MVVYRPLHNTWCKRRLKRLPGNTEQHRHARVQIQEHCHYDYKYKDKYETNNNKGKENKRKKLKKAKCKPCRCKKSPRWMEHTTCNSCNMAAKWCQWFGCTRCERFKAIWIERTKRSNLTVINHKELMCSNKIGTIPNQNDWFISNKNNT